MSIVDETSNKIKNDVHSEPDVHEHFEGLEIFVSTPKLKTKREGNFPT
jgi:hypothetical protein